MSSPITTWKSCSHRVAWKDQGPQNIAHRRLQGHCAVRLRSSRTNARRAAPATVTKPIQEIVNPLVRASTSGTGLTGPRPHGESRRPQASRERERWSSVGRRPWCRKRWMPSLREPLYRSEVCGNFWDTADQGASRLLGSYQDSDP